MPFCAGIAHRRFQVAAAQPGSAVVPCRAQDLERIFSLQFERTVNRDNTVKQSHWIRRSTLEEASGNRRGS
jgi:hypothetical protein